MDFGATLTTQAGARITARRCLHLAAVGMRHTATGPPPVCTKTLVITRFVPTATIITPMFPGTIPMGGQTGISIPMMEPLLDGVVSTTIGKKPGRYRQFMKRSIGIGI